MVFDEFNPLDVLATAAELSCKSPSKALPCGAERLPQARMELESMLLAGGVDQKEPGQQQLLTDVDSTTTSIMPSIIGDADVVLLESKPAVKLQSQNQQLVDVCPLKIAISNEPSSTLASAEDDDASSSVPPDSATSDLLDHSYAGSQMGAAMSRQVTEDDDGYSSRSSVDSPGGQTWRSEELDAVTAATAFDSATNTPSTSSEISSPSACTAGPSSPLTYLLVKGDTGAVVPILLAPVDADNRAELASSSTDDSATTSTQKSVTSSSGRRGERRMSDGSDLRPVQVVAPFISRRRATTESVGIAATWALGTGRLDTDLSAFSPMRTCIIEQLVGDLKSKLRGSSDAVDHQSLVLKEDKPAVSTDERFSSCSNSSLVANDAVSRSASFLVTSSVSNANLVCETNASIKEVLSPLALTAATCERLADHSGISGKNNTLKRAGLLVGELMDSSNASERQALTNSLNLAGFLKSTVRTRLSCGSALHPLVDHDYCTFAAFSADIQSSIIATTDLRQRTERKNATKSRILAQLASSSVGRTHRQKLLAKHSRKVAGGRLILSHKSATLTSSPKPKLGSTLPQTLKGISGRKLSSSLSVTTKQVENRGASRRKLSLSSSMPKSAEARLQYHDQFVYSKMVSLKPTARQSAAAEKKLRHAANEVSTIGGDEPSLNNVFDWYKDLAKIDKGREFGSSAAAPVDNSSTLDASFDSNDSTTPLETLKDSDVIDMVYDMMPKNDDDFPTLDEVSRLTAEVGAESSALLFTGSPSSEAGGLSSLFASVDVNTLFPTGLADLDSICSTDLLQVDFSNITALLGDLSVPPAITGGSVVKAPSKEAANELTREKLVLSAKPAVVGVPKVSAAAGRNGGGRVLPEGHATPPELVMVSMYWNDLPGLVIGGQQYIRLVDIHRQVLPAKETAILKKRCQMFGYEVANCTDMQRDFLIRYANAAKSKSTWIVSRNAADRLIGFYIDPRIKTEMEEADRLAGTTAAPASRPALARAPSVVINAAQNTNRKAIQPIEVIQSSKAHPTQGNPRPGVPCVIVRDTPRVSSAQPPSVVGRSAVTSQSTGQSQMEHNFKAGRRESVMTTYVRQPVLDANVKTTKRQASESDDQQQRVSRRGVSEDEETKRNKKAPLPPSVDDGGPKPLSICHKDNHRSGYRGRFQGGYLFLDKYDCCDAACVQCDICLETMSLRQFLKHMHRQADPDQLILVSFPQKFELYNFEPTSDEIAMWNEFERKQKKFDPAAAALMKMLPASEISASVSISSDGVGGNSGAEVLSKTPPAKFVAQSVKETSVGRITAAQTEETEIVQGSLAKSTPQLSVASGFLRASPPDVPMPDGNASRHSQRLRTKRQQDDYEYPSKRSRMTDA